MYKRQIDSNMNKRFVPHAPTPPNIYGLPNTHKPNNPLRPIISCINSPTYETYKWLANILKSASPVKCNIRDSFTFDETIKKHKIPPNHILISLDISFLFTNVNIQTVVINITQNI